jgi:tRNA (guanine10-N2)-dimethyltransferase
LKNKVLVLLSGERTSIPQAEARSLFLTYDKSATFSTPEERILVADTEADPNRVARRIAFARRVGLLLNRPEEGFDRVKGKRIAFRSYSIGDGYRPQVDVASFLRGVDASVDLDDPDYEFTLITGSGDHHAQYLILSSPKLMEQAWASRRPRRRAFFHPSAIFPKLSRALVNLAGCREGEVFLDPFAGTGSLPIEAAETGLRVIALDLSRKMVRGALANMEMFSQTWLGVVRGDASAPPLTRVNGIATDVPYGRASSTSGKTARSVVDFVIHSFPSLLDKGSKLVLMHPNSVPVEGTEYLGIEEEHQLYVHRKLIRTITVLRRT